MVPVEENQGWNWVEIEKKLCNMYIHSTCALGLTHIRSRKRPVQVCPLEKPFPMHCPMPFQTQENIPIVF